MRPIVPALLAALLCHGVGRAADIPVPASFALPEPVAKLLAERSAPLRAEAQNVSGRRLPGQKAPATLETIVISCDFADSLLLGRYGQVPGDFPAPGQTDRHYAAHDAVFLRHKLQDVAAYFADASGGALEIRYTVHDRTVNLPLPMSWYGNHPTFGEQPVALVAAVIDSLDQEIDFTIYDTIVLVHAGAGEETDILGDSPEQIYSTYLNPDDFAAAFEEGVLAQPYVPAAGFAPGTGIDRVLVLPETEQQDPFGNFGGGFGSLGVFCFEFGLHLGMFSLSDFTPSGRPDSQGVGQYDLMGYGLFVGLGFIPPQPCPLNKVLMGWLAPYTADPATGAEWPLTPAADVAGPLACARVNVNGREYWLAEYRLQDPNGDRRFSFPGDLNGNGLPDFWDADSEGGDGRPTGLFDAATDTHEDLRGAEWDFAMSENSARAPGELGAGSGVYVWHVDEAVIASVFGGSTNLFNADPARKSVDLEEADGIQDLDSNEPSLWQLGGDDDSFRGEDNDRFGPDTRPDTRSNEGQPTGVVMRDFSRVVRDSAAYEVVVGNFSYPGYDYADTMTFRLERLSSTAEARFSVARRSLPAGVDLAGSHLMAVDLDDAGGQEIVAADRHGGVWAFAGDLSEYRDGDNNAATIEPLASGWRAGAPADWHLPAAAGDLDGDGAPEIILTTRDGLYAFRADGSPVREAEAGAVGLYADVPGCSLPPVLLPVDRESERGAPGVQVAAVVAWHRDGACGLTLFAGEDGQPGETIELGAGHVAAAPQVFGSRLLVCVADTVAGEGRLAVVDLAVAPLPSNPEVVTVPLQIVPGSWPPVAGWVPGGDPLAPPFFVMVVSVAGAGQSVVLNADLTTVAVGYRWPADLVVSGPVAPGGALVAGDRFGRVGQGGDWLNGWPRSASPATAAGPAGALVARIVDAPDGHDHYLFTAADGRLMVRGARGEDVPGWPLAGPGTSAGTPALGVFGGGAEVDLVAAGSFPRIVGNADDGERLVTRAVSELVVWHDVASAAVLWPMWGGSAWRSGAWDAAGFVGVPAVAGGTGLVPGSHFCYPNPLVDAMLHVRGQLRGAGRALATIHDLSGEQVATSSWQAVAGVEPFSLDVDLSAVASGMYICRLVVESDGGGSDVSVVTFAVEH